MPRKVGLYFTLHILTYIEYAAVVNSSNSTFTSTKSTTTSSLENTVNSFESLSTLINSSLATRTPESSVSTSLSPELNSSTAATSAHDSVPNIFTPLPEKDVSFNTNQRHKNITVTGFWNKFRHLFQEVKPFECGNDIVGNIKKIDNFVERRNVARRQFLVLGQLAQLTTQQLGIFTKAYDEVMQLECDIDHYVHCIVKKEPWSWKFWHKLQRLSSDSNMYRMKAKLDTARTKYFNGGVNVNKTAKEMKEQTVLVCDIEGYEDYKDAAEYFLNLGELLPPQERVKRKKKSRLALL